MPPFFHGQAKTLRGVARVNEAHAATGHGSNLSGHEVENNLG